MRYQIWDKKTDIFTPSGHKFTAAEWLAKYPWADLPGVKMIITSGTINGGAAMEFQATVDRYMEMGADFSSCETDEDYLAAIEDFELHPPGADQPSIEERTAAALEALEPGSERELMLCYEDDGTAARAGWVTWR